MQSILKPVNALTVLSIIQLVLALIGIVILFNTPFGGYELRIEHNTSTAGEYYSTYENRSFFVGYNSALQSAAIVIAVIYLVFAYVSLFRILSPNLVRFLPLNQELQKYARFTPLLGLSIIVLGFLALWGVSQAYSEIASYSDVIRSWPDVGVGSIFVGGVIVAVTGVLANRMSRSAVQTAYRYPSQPVVQPAVSSQPQPSYPCPTCGRPLTYVQQYNRWYCYSCQKYA
jgi:hypothetical protein